MFYHIKPIIPRKLQVFFRRIIVRRRLPTVRGVWPIDEQACRTPEGWTGWKGGKKFALVLTHDVETLKGHNRCAHLMALEKGLGFRSTFNFVPELYEVSAQLRRSLKDNGFEVSVHGLKHDGKLYRSRKEFQRRATRINVYLKEWNSVGFRSPAMHHNLDWIHDLNIEWDASTFDTDPFEPQPDGVGTIFPFWIKGHSTQNGYVELPYTLPQDFTLFVLMKEKNIDIWKRKLDWIAECGGMALLNVHPDYINFEVKHMGFETYPSKYYEEFLQFIQSKYAGQFWNVLPKEMARFWRKLYQT